MTKETLNWKIRPIQQADNPIVTRIITEGLSEYACVGEGYASADPEVQDMFAFAQNPRTVFVVLVNEQDQVIGCGGIAPLKNGSADTCELQKLYFLEAARGKGYGRRFVQHCLDHAKKLGYKKCYLETVERMTVANALYQKMGFEVLENNMGCTGHGSCDTYYVKSL
ncbi:MAG: GNAT family N-acetyltransferase [Bacteroidota bacterium]